MTVPAGPKEAHLIELARVAALNGALEVSSPAGGGTVLRLEIPCGS